MSGQYGFRGVKVIENSLGGTIDDRGAYIYVEVTNGGATIAKFYPNNFPDQGHPAIQGIPIAAGQTRNIPMAVYNFTADAAVTVVAYRM